jgi:hypothetical protein
MLIHINLRYYNLRVYNMHVKYLILFDIWSLVFKI